MTLLNCVSVGPQGGGAANGRGAPSGDAYVCGCSHNRMYEYKASTLLLLETLSTSDVEIFRALDIEVPIRKERCTVVHRDTSGTLVASVHKTWLVTFL